MSTPFPNRWCWYSGSGAIVSWRPGQTARIIGHVGAIDRTIAFGQHVFVSSQASGELYRLSGDGSTVRVSPDNSLASDSVTCGAPFGPDQMIVGTSGNGLKIFDGVAFRNFKTRGVLNGGRRINDLCSMGGDSFAAAVDTVGIVFFDRAGNVVQVLDRTLITGWRGCNA